MFKLTVALALVACVAASSHHRASWEAFKSEHNKVYASAEEEATRFAIFQDNVEFIREENSKGHSYTLGVNQFSDLSHDEFKKMYLRPMNRSDRPYNFVELPAATDAEVDWRSKGAVTPVKNQGQCGSCWSFSTTGSVEGAWAIKTGKLVSLSEQQLMDCSKAEGDHSCEGGLMDYAFKYIIENGGLDTEEDYPYQMRDESCNTAKEGNKVVTVASYKDVPHSEEQLMAAIGVGPVSVAIEADQRAFQSYKSGVFDSPCGTNLDHGVLAVGFGTEGSDDYWIVKNSWGASWGDAGYIKMKREGGSSGVCGILMSASYPEAGGAPAPSPPSPPAPPPSPSGNPHYEDPNDGPCQSGEISVEVTGLSGKFCSPSCASSACPTDVPSGTTAQPECVLEMPGHSTPSNCALICQPGEDDTCPTKASCKPISGVGVCTYDS